MTIPLNIEKTTINARVSSLCQTKVCGDRIEGFDCGNEVADWLSDALNIPGLRLIRQNSEMKRITRNQKEKSNDMIQKEISLSNQAQFLLINKTSVGWLTNKVEDWADMEEVTERNMDHIVDRFRGNLIIESTTPLEEIEWKGIQIGNINFNVSGRKSRIR